MNFPKLFIKDKHPLLDFAYYGSKARRAAHPDVLIGGYVGYNMFREGDILDGNAVLNLIKCVRWNEWASQEKLEQHIEDTIIHVTQEDKDRWDNTSFVLSDWNELDIEAGSYIKNKPDVYTKDEVYTKTIIDLMLTTKADTNLLSNVAISGDYNDLINKPTIPTIPTNVSAFVNDAGYLTEHQDISGKLDVISDLDTIRSGAQAGSTALQPSALNDYYNKTQVDNKLSGKQDTISNLATIEAGAAKGATAYQLPVTGIPSSDLSSAVLTSLGKADTALQQHQDISGKVDTSSIGIANGVALLDENGKVPSSQLPSYVDDVLEYLSMSQFPQQGESGKIYVDISTNKTYRWGGSSYTEISESLALGETSSTAYAGDKGKSVTDNFNTHAANTDIHVTAAKQSAWNAKADVSYVEDNYLKKYIDTDPTGGHDYVEIGGVKWATMNIGALNIEDFGLYFSWGDTQGYTADLVGTDQGKKQFSEDDCKYYNLLFERYTKYNDTDEKLVLDASDDAVTAAWGEYWRMPTTEEFLALGQAVNVVVEEINGTKLIKCTDKNDSSKFIYFPYAGSAENGNINSQNYSATYHSSSKYSTSSEYIYSMISRNEYETVWNNYYTRYRYVGCPVRGVYVGPYPQRIPVSGATEAEKTTWNNKSDFSGSYNDLTDKPTIPTVAQSDWNLSDNTAIDYIKNKPTIPTVPTNVSAFTNDAGYLTQHLDISGKANIADLATVATSGSYTDLSNTPSIPAAQVNSDWSANSGVALILNKPTLATVATSGSYNDLSNKPTIPSIWTGTQALYDAIVTKDPDTIYIITSTS